MFATFAYLINELYYWIMKSILLLPKGIKGKRKKNNSGRIIRLYSPWAFHEKKNKILITQMKKIYKFTQVYYNKNF